MEILREKFNSICEDYKDAFIDNYFTFDDGSKAQASWMSEEPGGILEVNDFFFGFDEIRLCVDNGYIWKDICEWYDYVVRLSMIDRNIHTPNLKSWINGCPRMSEVDIKDMELAKKAVFDAQRHLKEIIKEKCDYDKK